MSLNESSWAVALGTASARRSNLRRMSNLIGSDGKADKAKATLIQLTKSMPKITQPKRRSRSATSSKLSLFKHYCLFAIFALICSIQLLADCRRSRNFDDYEDSALPSKFPDKYTDNAEEDVPNKPPDLNDRSGIATGELEDTPEEYLHGRYQDGSRLSVASTKHMSLSGDDDDLSDSDPGDDAPEGKSRKSQYFTEKYDLPKVAATTTRAPNRSTTGRTTTLRSTKKVTTNTTTTGTPRKTSSTSKPRLTDKWGNGITTPKPSLPTSTTTRHPKNKAQQAQATKKSQAVDAAKKAIDKAKSAASTTKRPTKSKVNTALETLVRTEGKKVEAKRNTTIIINGRKFDQVNPIECVDEQFYSMLMKDLNLINPSETRDEYETYYDDERAKAISAIVEAPESSVIKRGPLSSTFDMSIRIDSGSRAGLAKQQHMDSMTSERLLQEIKEFWRETNATYTKNSLDLNMKFSRRKRAARKNRGKSLTSSTTSTPSTTKKPTTPPQVVNSTPRAKAPAKSTTRPTLVIPNYRRALENHQYLLHRLEELKAMLLNGEEAIIILNNRVKKLQQAVGEDEIQEALCSCITSRGGRAALMLISDLFTDKDAMKLLQDKQKAKSKAEDAARDTAEFCAYWYGDTLRSQAIMKEKQIRRLITKIKRQKIKQTITSTTNETTTSIKYVHEGHKTKKIISTETKIRVVTKMVEMTRLWQPELSNWIQAELGSNFTAGSVLNLNGTGPTNDQKRARRHTDHDEMFMSTPFDHHSLYTDVDDPNELESSGLLQSFILNNYQPSQATVTRGRREASEEATTVSTSTTEVPPSEGNSRASVGDGSKSTTTIAPSSDSPAMVANSTTTTRAPSLRIPTTNKVASGSTMTSKPSYAQAKENDPAANFEQRTSASASKCAVGGFSVLLDIAYDENAILYETSRIKRNNQYIQTMRDSYIKSFYNFWVSKRDEWSRVFIKKTKEQAATAAANTAAKMGRTVSRSKSNSNSNQSKTTTSVAVSNNRRRKVSLNPKSRNTTVQLSMSMHSQESSGIEASKSVDQLIDDTLESTGNSYERGARLGYTIGKFIGEKAARQWPDPAELNTFTYDSLFLAGVGHSYNAAETQNLEKLIVAETAKRVAFTESNRKAFAKALHSAYLNGAFIVPKFGVLHGQRAVAKRASVEGSQVGYEAASSAGQEFAPQAAKFFKLHEHQRALASPYKTSRALVSKRDTGNAATNAQDRKSLLGRLDEVKHESDLNAEISKASLECGQKSGAIMGALIGLLVVPEAFETYARVRGSLEAVESEFYRYKLGALRGYELGESWAMLNYTNAMAKRLESMRAEIGKVAVTERPRRKNSTSTSTKKPTHKKKHNKKIMRIPDDQMFSTMYETDPEHTNVNNIFQFMVVNYGERVVANHSRSSMLKLRSLVALDENILTDIKVQSGDLVDISANKKEDDEDEDVFETVKVAGELTGTLNSTSEKGKKFNLKLEIIDLGPLIEFADESAKPKNQTSSRSNPNSRASQLDVIPLTEALSSVNKLYINLRVAREKNDKAPKDELEMYLNSDQTDGGDGFLCGSYSHLGAPTVHRILTKTKSQQGQTFARETEDDLALEAAMLDELYDRIEHIPLGKSSVEVTEQAMRETTVAPTRIESIKTTANPTKATLAASKNPTVKAKTPKYSGLRLPIDSAPIRVKPRLNITRSPTNTKTTAKWMGITTKKPPASPKTTTTVRPKITTSRASSKTTSSTTSSTPSLYDNTYYEDRSGLSPEDSEPMKQEASSSEETTSKTEASIHKARMRSSGKMDGQDGGGEKSENDS